VDRSLEGFIFLESLRLEDWIHISRLGSRLIGRNLHLDDIFGINNSSTVIESQNNSTCRKKTQYVRILKRKVSLVLEETY